MRALRPSILCQYAWYVFQMFHSQILLVPHEPQYIILPAQSVSQKAETKLICRKEKQSCCQSTSELFSVKGCRAETSVPVEVPHFSHLFLWSHSFDYSSELTSIGEGCNIEDKSRALPSSSASLFLWPCAIAAFLLMLHSSSNPSHVQFSHHLWTRPWNNKLLRSGLQLTLDCHPDCYKSPWCFLKAVNWWIQQKKTL